MWLLESDSGVQIRVLPERTVGELTVSLAFLWWVKGDNTSSVPLSGKRGAGHSQPPRPLTGGPASPGQLEISVDRIQLAQARSAAT